MAESWQYSTMDKDIEQILEVCGIQTEAEKSAANYAATVDAILLEVKDRNENRHQFEYRVRGVGLKYLNFQKKNGIGTIPCP